MKAKRQPVLEILRMRVQRGNTLIIRDISWRVERGQHWVILGANGSGKTSLLSAIAGYLMPSAGEMSVLGRTYGKTDWRELRKKIGLVSSSVRQMMNDDETALESIISGKFAEIGLWRRVSPADRKHALAILRQVECARLCDRPWRVLSQGERQRVLIGRALMAEPKLLILDEPCAGLDPAAREHFLQCLERLARRKYSPTLIFVTHHVEEIIPSFTHAMILRDGKALCVGEKDFVLDSGLLSRAFRAKLRLKRFASRYMLAVEPKARAMM